MKKLLLFVFIITNVLNGFSQTQGINYQAVILDSNAPNNVLVSSNIDIRFTILNETDTEEYQETHNVTTDAYGMVNLQIGSGTVISSNTFGDINWGGLSKKLRVEIDFTGSGTYTSLNEQIMTFMPQPTPASVTQAINDNTSAIALNTAKVGVPDDSGASNGQILQTDGSGTLSWVDMSSSSGGINDLIDGKADGNGSSMFLGLNAGANDDGSSNANVGIGHDALTNTTSGDGNTAMGREALKANTTGRENTAIGTQALMSNTTAKENTAVGKEALKFNTTGYENTAIGKQAMWASTTGRNNTALGKQALWRNTTGRENTAIGKLALNNNLSGDGNIGIGYGADVSTDGLNNAIAIGFNSTVSASNTIQLGNSSITDVKTSGKITTGAITLPNTDGSANQVLTTNGSGTVTWSTPSIGFKSVFNDNLGPSYEITDTHNGVIIYENNSLSVSSSLTSGFICDYIYFSNHPGTITASSNILYTKGSNTATNSVSISSGDHIRIMAVAADKVYVTIY